jgi:two-component system LytT family sensor kinase
MLLTFSEMLRYQLYECNVEKIAIESELNYIKNYITLQRSRMDEQIKLCVSMDITDKSFSVAPLIMITFIENAFKYVGFSDKHENRIEINLRHEDNNLLFTVFNTKDGMISRPKDSSGLGIANARRRLEILYPDKHLLEIKDTESYYCVSLTLYGL